MPANFNDCTVHTEHLEHQIDKFGFDTESILGDASEDNSDVYDAMLKRGIKTYIPRRGNPKEKANYEEDFSPEKFNYDSKRDIFVCPAGEELYYRGFLRGRGFKNYPYKEKFISKANYSRRIESNIREETPQIQAKNINTPKYKDTMRLRRIWCEGNFVHQKKLYNLRRTRKSLYALNLKRMVKQLKERVFPLPMHKIGAAQVFLNSFFI